MWISAMPRVSIPPAPCFCRLHEGSRPNRQGGERRKDEFPHRFASSILSPSGHNDGTVAVTSFNHEFFTSFRAI
jgi:hypothetical protein